MKKNIFGFAPVIILVLVLVIAVVVGVFYFRRQGNNYSSSPTPPFFSNVKENTKLPSSGTVVVKGTVPAGWMFEGQLQIKLLDVDKKVIATAVGKETIPGSWQSSEPADFSGTLTFTTNAKSGYLVIEADNPSGKPENDKNYEIYIQFE